VLAPGRPKAPAIQAARLGLDDQAIWLPFQEATHSNHIPLWSEVEIVVP